MKFESVYQWGFQLQFWCTSNIHSWPEHYCRSQYTLVSSWRQTMYSSWYMRVTRRRMRLKDLKMVPSTVTTTFEVTIRSTMESTHKHAMRLQATQPVAPPAIPPSPCRAESDLFELSLPHLIYRWLFTFGGGLGHDFFGWRWYVVSEYFFVFLGCVVFVMCEYYLWCVSIIYSKMMLQKFCERATQMYYEFQTKKKSCEKNKTSERHRCTMSSKLKKKNRAKRTEQNKQRTDVLPALRSAS